MRRSSRITRPSLKALSSIEFAYNHESDEEEMPTDSECDQSSLSSSDDSDDTETKNQTVSARGTRSMVQLADKKQNSGHKNFSIPGWSTHKKNQQLPITMKIKGGPKNFGNVSDDLGEAVELVFKTFFSKINN